MRFSNMNSYGHTILESLLEGPIYVMQHRCFCLAVSGNVLLGTLASVPILVDSSHFTLYGCCVRF